MSQKAVKPRSRPIIEPKKVVEIGVYVTASQLRRLEGMMEKCGVKFSVLPEPDIPYRGLAEWFEECSDDYGTVPRITGSVPGPKGCVA